MKKITLLFVVVLASRLAVADIIDVNELNQKLNQRGAGWTAKQTWVNQLSKNEAQYMMGLREEVGGNIEFVIPQEPSRLPSSVDWRNKDNKNWVSPVLNQANCGSCVAFAAVGVLETQLNISSLLPNLNLRLSTQNLFACGGGSCDFGWYPGAAASVLMKKGVVDEACQPYLSGATGKDVACNAACSDASQRTYKIAGYSTPSRGARALESVKQSLQKGPLMTTLTVYEDFMAYGSGVYKHVAGKALGGHAISIVGYDDADQAFIIRNSWGEEWGEKGFGRVAYSDVSGVGDSTWGFQTPTMVGAVALQYPRDYDYVSGRVQFQMASTYARTKLMTGTVYDKTKQAVWSASCESRDCQMDFDSTALPEGRYEIQITAFDDVGQKIDASSRQFFYVVNQKPQIQISMTPKATAWDKVFSGRVEFDIKSQSSSVPLSAVVFHYKDSNGIEKTKTAQVVLDAMSMGWRTNIGANGTYEVWLTGAVKSNAMEVVQESTHYTVQVKN